MNYYIAKAYLSGLKMIADVLGEMSRVLGGASRGNPFGMFLLLPFLILIKKILFLIQAEAIEVVKELVEKNEARIKANQEKLRKQNEAP